LRHDNSPLCFEAELGVVGYRRRLTEGRVYRLTSPPSDLLHDISLGDVLSVQS